MAGYDEFKKAAGDVIDAVDDAVFRQDFSGLSRTIGQTVSGLANAAADAFSDKKGTAIPQGPDGRPPQEVHPERYFAAAESEQGPRILTVIGGALAVVFGVVTLLSSLVTSLIGFGSSLAVLAGIITACGIAMGIFGHRAARKRVRFKQYRKLILPKLYADIKDLSYETGRTEKQVVSDLQEYMHEGKIRQGHFDQQKTCFIASDELYSQYEESVRKENAVKEQKAAQKRREEQTDPAVREIVTKGTEYIDAIHRANELIPDAEITEKLDRMETIVRRIFDEVRRRPELAKNLNLLLNYYLPTTTKLMNAYIEMDRQTIEGENIRQAKKEISDSLSTINDAFENLLDSFFRDQAMDVSSDINVMKMMMKQEGLTEDSLTAATRGK